MKKVCIFHSGELTINAYYLAAVLIQHNISVDLFLYSPKQAYKKKFLIDLRSKVKKEINTIEFQLSFLENCLSALNKVIGLFGRQVPALYTNPLLPYQTNKKFKKAAYSHIITIGQASLYWLYRTDADCLKKTIHYSLEIQKITDPQFITPSHAAILRWESKLLKRIQGLIIQDAFRAEALLDCKIDQSSLNFIFVPVSIFPGNKVKERDYLYNDLHIPPTKSIILYFGAVYCERYLKEVAEKFESDFDDKWVLVLHGPHKFTGITSGSSRIKTSNKLLNYDDVDLVINSATIGLAFYDNSWPNTRYTAFSSEKIARYLQAGVPFIAFNNESYVKLKSEFNCCELIDDIGDLHVAVETIMLNLESYKQNCLMAFEKYYNIEKSVLPLIKFINSVQSPLKLNESLQHLPIKN